MARARKVPVDTAVIAARAVFWRHGFQALGTRQLEEETGITRFSLQTSFGGKMALFERALDSYLDQMEADLLPAMTDGTLDGLARWFEMRCTPGAMPPGSEHGCMMINAIAEFADGSEAVTARAQRFQRMLRTGFNNALKAIEDNDGVPEGFDRAAHVEVLVASAIGLNVTVRAGGDSNAAAQMAAGIGAMVRSWTRM